MKPSNYLLLSAAIGASTILSAQALTTTEIVAKAKPAIVLIECIDSRTGNETLGTGFFVDPTTIVTNDHVMRGQYDKLSVHKLDGTFYAIDYIANSSAKDDLCVLKVEGQGSLTAYLKLSDTPPMEGESIVVIGNPEGLTGTTSQGIVSALRANGAMQITAPVTHGSSGSPILNMNGDVVGVVNLSSNQNEANIGFGRDWATLKSALTAATLSHFGGPMALAQASIPRPVPLPTQGISQPAPQAVPVAPATPINDVAQISDLISRYMAATQNGRPMSLAPYTTNLLTQWYNNHNFSVAQAEASIANYYRAYPTQQTSYNIANLAVQALNQTLNGRPAYVVNLPFGWSARSRSGKRASGNSTLQAIIVLATLPQGYAPEWRIQGICNAKIS
jgi:Trypsin-like peptidase domain